MTDLDEVLKRAAALADESLDAIDKINENYRKAVDALQSLPYKRPCEVLIERQGSEEDSEEHVLRWDAIDGKWQIWYLVIGYDEEVLSFQNIQQASLIRRKLAHPHLARLVTAVCDANEELLLGRPEPCAIATQESATDAEKK